MQPGDYVAVWLPDGRFVTRWPEARATAANALVTTSKEAMTRTLAQKLSPDKLRRIAVFQFVDWSDSGPPVTATVRRDMLPQPVAAFASVLSKGEIAARLEEVTALVKAAPDTGSFWTELFIRSRSPIQDDATRQRAADAVDARDTKKRPFRRD